MGSEFDKKSLHQEVEVRMNSIDASLNKESEEDIEGWMNKYRKHIPIMDKLQPKGRRFSNLPQNPKTFNLKQSNSQYFKHMNLTQNFESNQKKEAKLIQCPTPQNSKMMKSFRKKDPSLKSYLIEEDNEIKLKNKSIDLGEAKIMHDYFKLSEEQD